MAPAIGAVCRVLLVILVALTASSVTEATATATATTTTIANSLVDRVLYVPATVRALRDVPPPSKEQARLHRQQQQAHHLPLAAKEIQGYMLRATGVSPPVVDAMAVSGLGQMNSGVVVVGTAADLAVHPIVGPLIVKNKDVHNFDLDAHPEAHFVHTIADQHGNTVVICGGATPLAALYSAYTFIEQGLGVRFLINGDVIPPTSLAPKVLPDLHLHLSPAFDVRGIQPFHDFTAGPDWWTGDEYKMIATQLTKMKMNFFGFHSYPMREPLVWVGPEASVGVSGNISQPADAYATSWRTTGDAGWGLTPRNTSTYVAGTSLMFDRDCYGSPVQAAFCQATNPATSTAMFDNALALVQDAFAFADTLGVSKAVGTELPLSKPAGMSSLDAFKGMFKRLDHVKPDFYWHWTPEGWEWGHNSAKSPLTKQATADALDSVTASIEGGHDFELATCGWTIGPLDEPGYFDKVLNGSFAALSSIDLQVGWNDVQPAYKQITNHKKWVIPWMEDDPGLVGAEMWANRTLAHGRQAAGFNITGLMGIHWRTFPTSLTIRALADVAWNLSLTVEDEYADLASAMFGPSVGPVAAQQMVALDSFSAGPTPGGPQCGVVQPLTHCETKLPRPGFGCCGRFSPELFPNASYVAEHYRFADDFASLRSGIADPEHLVWFDRWSQLFLYHKGIAEVQYAGALLAKAVKAFGNLPPAQQAAAARTQGLPLLANASRAYERCLTSLAAFTHTKGDMGMVPLLENMNWISNVGNSIDTLRSALLANSTASPVYKGSYVDKPNRAMRYGPQVSGYDIQSCGAACFNYTYFALQYSGVCFCDNSWQHATEYGPTKDCHPNGTAWCNAIYEHTPSADPVPAAYLPTPAYLGQPRVFVPAVRTLLSKALEPSFSVQAVVLATESALPATGDLGWRLAGATSAWTNVTMTRSAGRGVFSVTLPTPSQAFEWAFSANVGGTTLTYPVQGTVVVNVH